MTNTYRPLFSRNFLTGLILFCLIAILFLSSLGEKDVKFHEIGHNPSGSFYWMEIDNSPMTLALLLPTTTALNPIRQQQQALFTEILDQRLQTSCPSCILKVTPKHDRIEVTFRWDNNQPAPDIKSVWDTISQPIEPTKWADNWQKIQARHYIDNQKQDQSLINLFFQQIQPEQQVIESEQLATNYSALFTNPSYALSGDDAEDLMESLAKQLPQIEHTNSEIKNSLPTVHIHKKLEASTKFWQIIMGNSGLGRTANDFIVRRLSIQVIQDSLIDYSAEYSNINFRLLWAALKNTGYHAIFITSLTNPNIILADISSQLNEQRIEDSRNKLITHWQENMRSDLNQIQALHQIAFYGLADDTLESYVEQILEQDISQIQHQAKLLLEPKQSVYLLKPASN